MAGKYELKKSTNDKFYFNLKAGNGQVILTGQMYESKSGAQGGIESVRKMALLTNAMKEENLKMMSLILS